MQNRRGHPTEHFPWIDSSPNLALFGYLLQGVVCLSLLLERVSSAAEGNWVARPGYRYRSLADPSPGSVGFTLQSSSQTGVTFSNVLAQSKEITNHVYLNGSGVALGDVDGDGWCDLYFCGLDGPNVLYRNLGGWKFEDITASAGVACAGVDATSAALVDLDGDGDLDLIVNSMGGGTFCFLNDGRGHFKDISKGCGLDSRKSRSSMAFADVNGDGLLDVYISAYRTLPLMDMPQTYFEFKTVAGRKTIDSVNHRPVSDPEFANRFRVTASGGIEELGEGGELYLNRGNGHFAEVSFTDGSFLDEDGKPLLSRPYDWELSVMFRDVNGDGAPDLYVCNDFGTPDRFWINDGKGKFRAIDPLAIRKTSHFSMGVDFADVDHNGFDDFFVLDMLPRLHSGKLTQLPERNPSPLFPGELRARVQAPRNTLQINRGDGTYAEIADFAGVAAADWAWCPMFLDVDLDGWEDLLITNGNGQDSRHIDWVNTLGRMRVEQKLSPAGILESRRLLPKLRTPNLAFRNRGDLTFEEVGEAWGFHANGISHGMAAADLDNDGDLDVVVNNLNDGCGLYRNNATAPRVAVRLLGRSPNSRGIGARIRLLGGAVPQQHQEIISGGRYLSSDDAMRTFAAGSTTNGMTLEVFWRNGTFSRIGGVQPNALYEIEEPLSPATATPDSRPNRVVPTTPWFTDVSGALNHIHRDEPFDDFSKQPMLPWRLSQLGPGVSWLDLDGSGQPDLVVGTGRLGTTGVFRVNRDGGVQSLTHYSATLNASRDQTSLRLWYKTDGDPVLLIGLANYEDGLAVGASVKGYDLKARTLVDLIPGASSSTGPLALADVDGDGDLDLFVGGRVIGGHYPEPASSRLFRAVGDRFEVDRGNTAVFEKVGLVSDAVFSDLDNDGDPDLVLACEWGALRVFRNDAGQFVEVTKAYGLDGYRGGWNGVSVGDFDEDGLLDLVVSNWGRNTSYQAYGAKPLQLVFGDLAGASSVDLVEAGFVAERADYAPLRMLDLLSKSLPFLSDGFPTYRAYGETTLAAALGDRLSGAQILSMNWLESTLFLNRGSRFEAHALPTEAQWSPAFAVAVADLDGDGHEDLFLSQNHFGLSQDRPRLDAGRGLILRGDGHGGFLSMLGAESGIAVYGEGRGAALADYDGDGRVDLAVGQNSGPSKLYHNQAAKPGLRVRLIGTSANPEAIGAVIRWGSEGKLGPAREVHASGGYWSQNGAIQVIALPPSDGAVLEIRWPNGKTTRSVLPVPALEVTVSTDGSVVRVR